MEKSKYESCEDKLVALIKGPLPSESPSRQEKGGNVMGSLIAITIGKKRPIQKNAFFPVPNSKGILQLGTNTK
jgi:hypothetical protein